MGEYGALATAALVFLLVVLISFMALQLYNLRKPAKICGEGLPGGAVALPGGAAASAGRSRFMGSAYYSPSCSSEWLGRRRADCRGLTSGAMPSIDMFGRFGNGIGCGRLGVPP
jgi:hypothetical protein